MFIKQLTQDLIRHPISMVIIGATVVYIAENVKAKVEKNKQLNAINSGTEYSGYEYDGLFVHFKFDKVGKK